MTRGLEWVRDNYDKNNSRYIEYTESEVAKADYVAKKISMADFFEVVDAYDQHTLLPISSGGTSKVANGELVDYSYPASTTQGSRISIRAAVKNTGTASGTFRIQLIEGYAVVAKSTQFTVYAGQISPAKTMYVTTPRDKSSIYYTIQCVRII